jgi:hypothetical protein
MATTTAFGWETPDDTDLVKDGAAAIRTLGSSIDTSMAELKGGTTGQVLSKTSATDMDFLYKDADDLLPDSYGFLAGKNKIINGDFFWNQRSFSSTSTTATYGFDRWIFQASGATGTYSAQTFTLGAAPVAGYEGKNFARLAVTTGNDFSRLNQYIESVKTFAGQTVTVSFWAKGTNPTTAGNLKVDLSQQFGTGGIPSAAVNVGEQTFVLTSNWTRYSFVFNVSSISGKTLGTNNDDTLEFRIGQGSSVSAEAWTLDLWGVQVEAGSVATPFQTATGSIQGELSACQRYYWRTTSDGTTASAIGQLGTAASTTLVNMPLKCPVTMRVKPTSIDFSNLAVLDPTSARVNVTAAVLDNPSTDIASVSLTSSGLTAQRTYILYNQNTTET